MKTFTHAGVSTLNGETKIRYANDAMRVKVLAKGGHTDIDFVDLLEPMTKEQAVFKLVELKFGQGNAVIEQALEAEMTKRTDVPKADKAVAKPAKAVKSKPITLETIKAKSAPKAAAKATKTKSEIEAELDDAPF
jgi:hypothetical protein